MIYNMHGIFSRVKPFGFFSLKSIPKPCNSIVHALIGKRKRFFLLFFFRSLFKAPWFRINIYSESGTAFSVISDRKSVV